MPIRVEDIHLKEGQNTKDNDKFEPQNNVLKQSDFALH